MLKTKSLDNEQINIRSYDMSEFLLLYTVMSKKI